LLGFFCGWKWLSSRRTNLYCGLSILVFIMFSFIFWMLPHSIDAAVIDIRFNRFMLLNMFAQAFCYIRYLSIYDLKFVFCFWGCLLL
jgi:hypothetical protein